MYGFARTPAKREHSAASIPPSRLRLPTSLCTREALPRCVFLNFYGETYFLDSLVVLISTINDILTDPARSAHILPAFRIRLLESLLRESKKRKRRVPFPIFEKAVLMDTISGFAPRGEISLHTTGVCQCSLVREQTFGLPPG